MSLHPERLCQLFHTKTDVVLQVNIPKVKKGLVIQRKTVTKELTKADFLLSEDRRLMPHFRSQCWDSLVPKGANGSGFRGIHIQPCTNLVRRISREKLSLRRAYVFFDRMVSKFGHISSM